MAASGQSSHPCQSGPNELILLSRQDLHRLLSPEVSLEAIRSAYRLLADHREDQARALGFTLQGGSLHIKAGLLPGVRTTFAAKVNINLPGNEARHGRPTIQGVVVLVDTTNGRPLAVMESMALTALRTAATATLAATYGAKPNAVRSAIIGCGVQARYLLEALASAFPLREVRVFDIDAAKAGAFAHVMSAKGRECLSMSSVAGAVEGADLCVTCTTSKLPVLTADLPLTGCFIAAIGADNPGKQEIDAELLGRARILVDDLDACVQGGDLAHAIRSGTASRDRVHADLADLASGRRVGREARDELVIFDSTGSAVQDVALATAAYHAAISAGAGARFNLDGR